MPSGRGGGSWSVHLEVLRKAAQAKCSCNVLICQSRLGPLVVTGIPVLSEIPVLGNLFKTTSDTVARTELLALLTPRVLRDRQDARTITDDLRQRLRALPGLVPKIQ